MVDRIQNLTRLGQSLWYDNLQRKSLENGDLLSLIERGDIRGITSNPSIFHNAIAKTGDYDAALTPLAWAGWDAERIFWQLAIEDIRAACDLFRRLYIESNGEDGYVSLEVDPCLANDTQATIAQVAELWARVDRPNLMIKIPATVAGIPAIRASIAAGINVNITLIFSLDRYRAVMQAYIDGLSDRIKAGLPIQQINSVASFFVSRVDTKIDAQLPQDSPLLGKAAIANAKLAYEACNSVFRSPIFNELRETHRANPQRPLWASTGTKNPTYADTYYVDHLIGPDTVNTVPPATLDAYRDHGRSGLTITEDLEQAKKVFPDLETVGIKMDTVTRELEEEGVKAFESAFLALLESIDEKKKSSISLLGPLSQPVARRLSQLDQDRMSSRLWGNDAGLWTSDPAGQAEIRERLGWLNSIEDARTRLGGYLSFASEIHRESIDRVLILGMGGSSLTAEVFSSMLAGAGIEAKLSLAILDSTDPQQVAQAAFDFPPTKSLIIVASKSGGTAEVSAAFDYFWSLSKEDGSRFIAITDPGTSLESLARERGFRRIFSSDPRVGGRFSAMTDFGLLPAALLGMDLNRLLDGAERMKKQCLAEVPAARNPGIALGAVIAESALAGRDKLTILSDSAIAPLAGWIEQIIAESSGKDGKGILPIPNEPLDAPDLYGKDRLFVYLRQTGELDNGIAALRHAEFPVIELPISGPYQLGHEFFRWEMAVSTACHILGVNAFDQPDVQESKNLTKLKISEYRKDGVLKDRDLIRIDDLRTEIRSFLEGIKRGGFAAVNAYLPRNFETTGQLQSLRVAVRERARCAVSVGFGPRFQHSTGQYHKGGPNTGSFLQLLYDPRPGEEIPGEGIDFGTLLRAQAVGDYAALISAGRRVLRVVLSDPSDLRKLIHLVWDADDSTTTTSAVG